MQGPQEHWDCINNVGTVSMQKSVHPCPVCLSECTTFCLEIPFQPPPPQGTPSCAGGGHFRREGGWFAWSTSIFVLLAQWQKSIDCNDAVLQSNLLHLNGRATPWLNSPRPPFFQDAQQQNRHALPGAGGGADPFNSTISPHTAPHGFPQRVRGWFGTWAHTNTVTADMLQQCGPDVVCLPR